MPYAVSPHYLDTDFPKRPFSLNTKITLFADRVFGWQLDIAESLKRDPHAGFAILAILLSYFEMIGKYEHGDLKPGSKRLFKLGCKSVLKPYADALELEVPDKMLNMLYEEARCGMYHQAMTGARILLSNESADLIQWNGEILMLNPHQLVDAVRRHFAGYIGRLMSGDKAHEELRRRFNKVFDAG